MSRTRHHLNQKRNKCGYDWGSKRAGNIHYAGTPGPEQKQITSRRERAIAKEELFQAIKKPDSVELPS